MRRFSWPQRQAEEPSAEGAGIFGTQKVTETPSRCAFPAALVVTMTLFRGPSLVGVQEDDGWDNFDMDVSQSAAVPWNRRLADLRSPWQANPQQA